MAFMYFEGTRDYVAATPALITTFQASGSIAAGRLVGFVSTIDQRVFTALSTSALQGAGAVPAGLALQTVSDGDPCPVLVWGYAKNIATGSSTGNVGITMTYPIVMSGAGYATTSGSLGTGTIVKSLFQVGKAISGSAGSITAFINCMW
jgi:hypothetical protein